MHLTSVQCQTLQILAESCLSEEVTNIMPRQSLLTKGLPVIVLGFHEVSSNGLVSWVPFGLAGVFH